MARAFILVMDSFGIGSADDAESFGDHGSDTFGHILEACAKPKSLGICPAVQEISALLFFCLVKSFQEPSSLRLCVVK